MIEVITDDPNDIGPHDMILTVTLVDYGVSMDFPFDIQIDSCILESIDFDDTISTPQTYKVDESPLKIPLPSVS